MATCKRCGDDLLGGVDHYCPDCYVQMPVCDDCDEVIEDGDYHLCKQCHDSRHP